MRVVLCIDMLGARALWRSGGAAKARAAFDRYTSLVIAAARAEGPGRVLGGGTETDAAILVCDSLATALRIARRMYLSAFHRSRDEAGPQLWLRGAVVRHDGEPLVRSATALKSPLENLSVHVYADSAYEALSVEKSGFKGMRLLVSTELVTGEVRAEFAVRIGERTLVPLKQLRHSSYPDRTRGEFVDYLWMADAEDARWQQLAIHMTARLRRAAKDPEEFAQAAATQVVFHECGAIRESLRLRTSSGRPVG